MYAIRVRLQVACRLAAVLASIVMPVAADADMVTLSPTADATISDPNRSGTYSAVDSTSLVDSVRDFPGLAGTPVDRSVITYSLAGLASGDTINSVSFLFDTQSYTSGSPRVDLVGFARDGSAFTTADATTAATLLGTYNPAALGLNVHTVSLGGAADTLIQSLLGGHALLALRIQASDGQSDNTQLYSIEGAASLGRQAPVLVVNYTPTAVPEPSSLALAAGGAASLVLAVRRRRRDSRLG